MYACEGLNKPVVLHNLLLVGLSNLNEFKNHIKLQNTITSLQFLLFLLYENRGLVILTLLK